MIEKGGKGIVKTDGIRKRIIVKRRVGRGETVKKGEVEERGVLVLKKETAVKKEGEIEEKAVVGKMMAKIRGIGKRKIRMKVENRGIIAKKKSEVEEAVVAKKVIAAKKGEKRRSVPTVRKEVGKGNLAVTRMKIGIDLRRDVSLVYAFIATNKK